MMQRYIPYLLLLVFCGQVASVYGMREVASICCMIPIRMDPRIKASIVQRSGILEILKLSKANINPVKYQPHISLVYAEFEKRDVDASTVLNLHTIAKHTMAKLIKKDSLEFKFRRLALLPENFIMEYEKAAFAHLKINLIQDILSFYPKAKFIFKDECLPHVTLLEFAKKLPIPYDEYEKTHIATKLHGITLKSPTNIKPIEVSCNTDIEVSTMWLTRLT